MKALITITGTANGDHIQLLGSGATESKARMAAYTFTHNGRNPYDDEYQGGQLVDCTQRLAEALHPTEEGEYGENYTRYSWATGSLYITADNKLDAAHYSKAEWEAARGRA